MRHGKRSSSRNNLGFTLIELILTIVILGALSATAISRFIDLGTEARVTTLNQALGSMRAAAHIANMKCVVSAGCYTSASDSGPRLPIGPNGEVGVMHWGYPTGSSRLPTYFGLKDWMVVENGMTLVEIGATMAEVRVTSAPDPANCKVIYFEASGYGATPNMTMVQSGC